MQSLKITELPFFIGGSDQVSNLNIELFISTVADKINFGVVQLADLNFIATAPHFQIYDVLIQLVAVKLFAFLDNVPQAKIDCIVLFCAGQERFSFDIIAACIQKDKGFLEIINVVQYGSSGCLDSFRNHASTDITGRKRIADIIQQECKDIT